MARCILQAAPLLFGRSRWASFPLALTAGLGVLCACGGGGGGAATPSERAQTTPANAFYVAKSGNDGNPGTAERSWLTLQKAASTLTPGDTVYVRSGTYNERLVPARSGNAGQVITYSAQPGETVTIDGTGFALTQLGGVVDVSQRSYITISGFRVINSQDAGILAENATDIVIQGNRTYNTASSGIGVWGSRNVTVDGNEVEGACTGPWQEHISVADTDGFEVRNNRVHDVMPGTRGKEGICLKDGSRNGRAYGNQVYNLQTNGIYVDASDAHTYNIDVYGNVVHDIPANNGIAVASEVGGLLENVRVYNNVAYRNQVGIWVSACCPESRTHPIRKLRIINNTCYRNGANGWGGGIAVENQEAEDVVIRNNIVSQNLYFQLAANAGRFVVDHNLIDGFRGTEEEIYGSDAVTGDPLFVNPAAADFHLQPGSPAIDRGSSTEAPTADFDGVSRPQGAAIDIGAFERR
jgi:hypothetical protein